MVYYGTNMVECIEFHTAGDPNDGHFIMMTKRSDAPIFTVECCCDSEWRYDFWMKNNSDYERVKFNVMEAIFECEDMNALMRYLGEIFEDGFEDILVEEECHCDGDCEHCNCEE